MYKNIISLGFNCAVASSLRKYGLRNRDYPFDWGVSILEGILDAINEKFVDFFDESWITDIGDGTYYHSKYKYSFVHDFQDGIWNEMDFQGQMQYVKNKYRRKVSNFLGNLECGETLFVRLIQNLQEAEYIAGNMESIKQILRIDSNSNGNSIVWIGEKLVAAYFRERDIPIYEAEIVWKDGGTGLLLDRNAELKQHLLYGQIDSGKQMRNLLYVQHLQEEREKKLGIEISIRDKIFEIMYDSRKKRLLKDHLQQKEIVIYGANNLGMALGSMLKSMDLHPMYYLDKYKKKVGTYICDREVISLHQAAGYEKPDIIIMAIPYEGASLEEVMDRLRQFFLQSRIEGVDDFLDGIVNETATG